MILAPTDGFTDLVLHVLAHVRLGGAGCLRDSRIREWALARMPDALARMLEHDAAVLEQAWSNGRVPWVVHAWPELLGSLDDLQAIATQELAALTAAQVRAPEVLARIHAARTPALELFHATLCTLAPWYAQQREAELVPALLQAVDRARPWLDQATRVLPSLASARVELSWSLGPRGRAFPSRIVVGAPAAWNDMEARTSAVLAMHEQAVHDAGHPSYAEAEWAALTGLAARMLDAPDPLREAHARWLASLELRPLLTELHAQGTLTTEDRRALAHEPDARTARLARLATR